MTRFKLAMTCLVALVVIVDRVYITCRSVMLWFHGRNRVARQEPAAGVEVPHGSTVEPSSTPDAPS